MDFEEIFQILDADVFSKNQRRLKDVERFVLQGAWRDQTYDEMAQASDYRYTPSYLKQDVGPKLWKLLSETLGEQVSKTNFRAAIERQVYWQEVLQNHKQLTNLEAIRHNLVKEQDSQDIFKELAIDPETEQQLSDILAHERVRNRSELIKRLIRERWLALHSRAR